MYCSRCFARGFTGKPCHTPSSLDIRTPLFRMVEMMSEAQRVKILVVDDLPEKLLVYRTILESPALEVVTAANGPEALRHLLNQDFAVILLDINMPGMDGYEAAQLIRRRKRSAHTPIIFITAFADELHTLKGYSYGAVDYILSPVVPDVLRTKVQVFADLHRLTEQTRDAAARRVARAERESARLSAVLETSSDLVAQLDPQGRVLQINSAGLRMLGYGEDDVFPSHIGCIMSGDPRLKIAADNGVWFGESSLTTNGGRGVQVSQLLLSHQSEDGSIESFSLLARDMTEKRQAERAQAHLAAIVESSDDAIVGKDLDGIITSWNAGAERLFGYTAEEAIGKSVLMLIPPDRASEEQAILQQVRAGLRVPPFESIRVARDGRRIDVSLRISPTCDAQGRPIGASKIARDITARKRTEAELAEHRARLEHLVIERTSELQATHERLRLSDRLASIGTLAAGLGHDMGNLLLPIRARIASLETLELAPAAREHIAAIKTAGEYLKRLSQGLRLLALDPGESSMDAVTTLGPWKLDVEPLLRNALPKGVAFEIDMRDTLPPIRMPPHTFTQVIFNLVQNAGDAMRNQDEGMVRVTASATPKADSVVICVTDNGPGMTSDVREHCLEPFFTTRTRRISTGLGLALVRGAVCSINGTIEIDSQPGSGTTFRLTIPAAPTALDVDAAALEHRGSAVVDVRDKRRAAYLTSLLRGMGFEARPGAWAGAVSARLLILEADRSSSDDVRTFLDGGSDRLALIFGQWPEAGAHPQTICLDSSAAPQLIRGALRQLLLATPRPAEAVHS